MFAVRRAAGAVPFVSAGLSGAARSVSQNLPLHFPVISSASESAGNASQNQRAGAQDPKFEDHVPNKTVPLSVTTLKRHSIALCRD